MRELAGDMLKLVRKRRGDTAPLRRQIAEHEIAFHQIVLAAAGGRLTSQFHQVLIGYFDEAYGQSPHRAPPRAKDMQDHVKLAQAFATRDVATAVAIMSDHIQPMLENSP